MLLVLANAKARDETGEDGGLAAQIDFGFNFLKANHGALLFAVDLLAEIGFKSKVFDHPELRFDPVHVALFVPQDFLQELAAHMVEILVTEPNSLFQNRDCRAFQLQISLEGLGDRLADRKGI